MRKFLWIIVLLFLAPCLEALAAQTAVIEREVKERELRPMVEGAQKEKLSLTSYYEYSGIKQAGRKGSWQLASNSIAYSLNDLLTPYLQVNSWERFHKKDYSIDFGSYIKFKDFSYLRAEIGFGGEIKYLYRFQSTLEYQHRMVKNLFWQFGYRYLNYTDNDVFIMSPGLTYYFGNNYVSAFYNASSTESRGIAQWGTFKGYLALNERVGYWLGTAIGERLYDIQLRSAKDQYSFIIFSGLDLKVLKNTNLKLGYSYSMERPNFLKRSLDLSLNLRF